MIIKHKAWKGLFLACLGIFAASAFCMKWMEGGFIQNGSVFTIIGLEISYPKEKVAEILAGLDPHVRTILGYHLSFDFVFMAGVYPGIAALCMIAAGKTKNTTIRIILVALAAAQALAWACDIYENTRLLKWMQDPSTVSGFGTYHLLVSVKWILALAGALFAIPLSLKKSPGNQ